MELNRRPKGNIAGSDRKGTHQKKRECGEIRRQQIAQAALRIICEHGLHRLTAVELAREVGIADGTIFRHCRDKSEIVRMAVDYLHQLVSQDFPPDKNLPPLQRLETFVLQRLRLLESNPKVFALAFSDRLTEAAGKEGLASLMSTLRRMRSFVEECLRQAQTEGIVDSRLAVKPLAVIVLGTIHSAALSNTLKVHQRNEPPKAVWETVKTLLCQSGVAAAAATQSQPRELR